mmetsp:Transcript_89858/g.192716  ORF Transcript_89858/g.192716 Transcript_89858/m.192716 type:complete len:280 (-) Transcript_89858:418-1257(-)
MFVSPVLSLISHVVEHHDGARLLVGLVPLVLVEEVYRHQPCLPVVDDEADLLAIDRAAQFQHERCLCGGHGQQREAEEVVLIFPSLRGIAVQPSRPVEGVVIHEDIVAALPSAILLPLVVVLYIVKLPIEPDLGRAYPMAVLVVTIPRGYGHGPVTSHCKLVGEGACYHCETPRLRPRVDLRGYDDDGCAEVPRPVPDRPLLNLVHLVHLAAELHEALVVQHLVETRKARCPPHFATGGHVGGEVGRVDIWYPFTRWCRRSWTCVRLCSSRFEFLSVGS